MKDYKTLNRVIGWVIFAIAAFTYLSTIEPSASYWDCPEYIVTGYKLEVGHPPGNPVFMLAARFVINFCGANPENAAIAVNALSAIFAAGTILLLFWTITYLVKKLVMCDGTPDEEMSWQRKVVIFGSGLCGALVYTWSDTFWFSAVEAEVYSISSFCTALVVWLMLRWESRADDPTSDRYLILIAYIVGLSIAIHLLNLLCIPALVLIFYYRKWKSTTATGSLIALAVSFAMIVLILYGLVPGFVEVAQEFELFFVNTVGLPFNTGVLIYAFIDVVMFSWCIYELYVQRSATRIKWAFFLSMAVSGVFFIGNSWYIPVVLGGGLAIYLYGFCRNVPVRIFNVIVMSVFVIFIGYSSYATIMIRSISNTPMDQNGPDNVFSLSSYLNREQYGKTPLLYGESFNSGVLYELSADGNSYTAAKKYGAMTYAKKAKSSPDEKDSYIETGRDFDYVMTPELNMLFPRMFEGRYKDVYESYCNDGGSYVNATIAVDRDGNPISSEMRYKPSFLENLSFFMDYQLNYMYWRYFMWNFVGRQNDLAGGGSGDICKGNWISGIPFIDNPRLGDQSLMPDDWSKNNKGHNVFYMLPLILGIIGLLWQAFAGKRGIEQFWMVFFFFFMTGIAIILYLNQTPAQPRERDYAFAGSFYAFAIWVGMGVAGIWNLFATKKKAKNNAEDNSNMLIVDDKRSGIIAIVAAVIGILVPIQMVSQTWDDHDRSGRYACRDFGMNYLSCVGPNGIIYTNGDNDTFPLWYAQEVEGFRTDVRVCNLSYLSTDWYVEQMRRPAYDSEGLKMQAADSTYAYSKMAFTYFGNQKYDEGLDSIPPMDALASLKEVYAQSRIGKYAQMPHPNMFVAVDKASVMKNNIVNADEANEVSPFMPLNMTKDPESMSEGGLTGSRLACLDIIATDIANGFKRPIYFASTVPDSYYLGLGSWLRSVGLAYELVPIHNERYPETQTYGVNTDRMYDNVMNKFRWGGLDGEKSLYIDETIGRMVTTHRSAIIDLANALIAEGSIAQELAEKGTEGAKEYAAKRFEMARNVLNKMQEKLPQRQYNYGLQIGCDIAQAYYQIGYFTKNQADVETAKKIYLGELLNFAQYYRFYASLSPSKFNLLTRNDMYVLRSYVPMLIQDYYALATPDEFKSARLQLMAMNVPVDEILRQLAQQDEEPAEEASVATDTAQ